MDDLATPLPPITRLPTPDELERELVGRNISRARIAAGLTQEELADQLRVPRQQLSMWERGRRLPSARYRYAIADALGRVHDLSWFYSGDDDGSPASAPD
jgi:transcriptional regulator with XRE-family HTH domain